MLDELARWFLDPANWSGRDAIGERLLEHVAISGAAVLVGVAIAVPVGLYIGHTRRGGFLAISLANVGRALPSYALLMMLFGVFVTRTDDLAVFANGPTLLAMIALAIPPILTNTYIGVRDVDEEVVESARAMGMRAGEVLRRVELPLALPVMLAGLRTATVQVIATAALGAVIGGGGLGRYIVQGIARQDEARLLAGAVMVAGLAIGADLAIGWLQRLNVRAETIAAVGRGPRN